MSKTILVTGGSGFMGSNFIRRMYTLYPDYKILNYDLLTYAGNRDNLADIEKLEAGKKEEEKRYVFVQGDICDVETLNTLFLRVRVDAVINFAAESHVDRSLVDSAEFVRSNITGVHVLLNLVRAHHVEIFIQISTDEIYGDVSEGSSDEHAPMRPSNPYAASKAGADLLVQSYMRSHAVPAIIVRGSNNFGPYQYPEKLIPLTITNLLDEVPIPVHGTGEHVRTWIHVEDFCRAVDLILHNAQPGSIYNVAGSEKKNLEVIEAIARILGKDFKDAITYVDDRPGADMRYAPRSTKLMQDLGWEPQRPLDDSLRNVVDWYIKNPGWWKTIKEKQVFRNHYEKQRYGRYY